MYVCGVLDAYFVAIMGEEEGAAASSPYALITEEGENRESAIGYTGKVSSTSVWY